MKKRTVNPLIKRIPKELIGDWKKYLIVFAFLVLTIGFVSGMYVANESMMTKASRSMIVRTVISSGARKQTRI